MVGASLVPVDKASSLSMVGTSSYSTLQLPESLVGAAASGALTASSFRGSGGRVGISSAACSRGSGTDFPAAWS